MRFISPLLIAAMTVSSPFARAQSPETRLEWQPKTLTLIEKDAGYGRIIRLQNKSLLCSYEKGGKSYVRRSTDNGKTWKEPVLVAQSEFGGAANPELLQLKSGRLLLFYNFRPRRDPHRFAIKMAVSTDNGATWSPKPTIFEASSKGEDGCWEPAAIELPSGEIQLYFANEYPYKTSNDQEISLCRSKDGGATWTQPKAIIFRAGHRDGMPVPVLLRPNTRGEQKIVVAIEDNGITTGPLLQPVIISTPLKGNWSGAAVSGTSPQRWGAVTPPLTPDIYAGAPYLRQLPTGETILSCQSTEGKPGAPDMNKSRMIVYVGDSAARNFTNRTEPFPNAVGEGLWNALMIKDANTVTAISGTTINGVRGLWAIDARVVRPKK